MRVKELSDLAGTTVRAVRHYHHIGLLDVPTKDGVRDSNSSHLGRLTRIRFLADSGPSPTQINRVLQEGREADGEASFADEPRRAELAIDEAIAELQSKRRMLRHLLRSQQLVEIPMPERVARFYDNLAGVDPPPSPAVLNLLMQEPQIMELLARTHVLASLTDFFPLDMSDTRAQSMIALCEAFLELGNQDPDLAESHSPVRPLVLRCVGHSHAITLLSMTFPDPLQRLYVKRFLICYIPESAKGQGSHEPH